MKRIPQTVLTILAVLMPGYSAGAAMNVTAVADISSAKVILSQSKEEGPLASWAETVLKDGHAVSAKNFNFMAQIWGIPQASPQDIVKLKETSISPNLRAFWVHRKRTSGLTAILLMVENKMFVTNPRGNLILARSWGRENQAGDIQLQQARKSFAVELKFWLKFEEIYDRRKAKEIIALIPN